MTRDALDVFLEPYLRMPTASERQAALSLRKDVQHRNRWYSQGMIDGLNLARCIGDSGGEDAKDLFEKVRSATQAWCEVTKK